MKRNKFSLIAVDPLTQKAEKIRSKKLLKGFASQKPFRRKTKSGKWRVNTKSKHGKCVGEVVLKKPVSETADGQGKRKTARTAATCMICFEEKEEDVIFYFNCKYWRVGRKKTDKAVCMSCLQKLDNTTCPFCRSHGFTVPSKEKKKRKKKIKKSTLIVQRRKIRLERIRAESYGLRCFGYENGETTAYVYTDEGRINFNFFSVDGTSPIMQNPRYRFGSDPYEPTIHEQEASHIRYAEVFEEPEQPNIEFIPTPQYETPASAVNLNTIFNMEDDSNPFPPIIFNADDWDDSPNRTMPWDVPLAPRFFNIEDQHLLGEPQETRIGISLDIQESPHERRELSLDNELRELFETLEVLGRRLSGEYVNNNS